MMDRDPRFSDGRWLGYVVLFAMAFWLIVIMATVAWGKTIRNDDGGPVGRYTIAANVAVLRGDVIRIDGLCASACTAYLAAACVTPRADVRFHGSTGGTDAENARATALLANNYPPKLRKWFMRHAAHLHGREYVRLGYADLVALGVKPCQP